MPCVSAEKLCFSYGGKSVVEDITFTVNTGETWAVVGRNGAGKSTLIKCLCGLLSPVRGNVSIDGIDITKMPPKESAKRIAYVPQGTNRTMPPFTVREYVGMALFPYNTGFMGRLSDDNKKCVDDALALTDACHLADRSMNTLSGGEFQTALIAGAVAQSTPFLLLDEPTTHLDPFHKENIRQVIERVHKERGTAVVTVTHDVNFALSTHKNILAVINGKVFFNGTKDEFCVNAVDNLEKIFSIKFRGIDGGKNVCFYETAE
ncbi:MAG: ABC transporter ATP-binding protein [Chitinispirillales bacterium]|jgi:iron complex transport system ATP-binding protein|nr:ABC transporter ATP-binding protein [Chitinispirillales bacterium]